MNRFLAKSDDSLPVSIVDELRAHVEKEDLPQEITAAVAYCRTHLEEFKAPTGISASLETAKTLKAKLDKLRDLVADPRQSGGIVFGGSLAMLDLSEGARVRPLTELDVGRMRFIADDMRSTSSFLGAIGQVGISADCLGDNELKNLVKVDRDAETDMAALAIYWHKDHSQHCRALAVQSQNMMFRAEQMGTGVDLHVSRFIKDEKRDDKRKVDGQSAYRKALALRALVEAAATTTPTPGRSSAQIAASLLSQQPNLGNWTVDTCGKYLALAARMSVPPDGAGHETFAQIATLMMHWEFRFKREALVDSIMVMRAVLSASTNCPDGSDLLYLLQTLFYEQIVGIRKELKQQKNRMGYNAVEVARALLLRKWFVHHLQQQFPAHNAATAQFASPTWCLDTYGFDRFGKRKHANPPCNASPDASGDNADMSPGVGLGAEDGDEAAAHMTSKSLLLNLLIETMSNKHELAFLALARAKSTLQCFDITADNVKHLRKRDEEIREAYCFEFDTPGDAIVGAAAPGQDTVCVGAGIITSAQEYQRLLEEWQQQCSEAEASELKSQ